MKGPESLLRGLDLSFRDPVEPGKMARLDSTMRVWIGDDAFYFANDANRRHFLREPLHWCRGLTDPVSMRRFQPTVRSPHLTLGGRLYYFEADSTRARFQMNPSNWAVRGPADEHRPMTMMPVPMPTMKH